MLHGQKVYIKGNNPNIFLSKFRGEAYLNIEWYTLNHELEICENECTHGRNEIGMQNWTNIIKTP